MRKAFAQARDARLYILEQMQSVLPQPRTELSPFAPRIITLQIPVDKIGALIGPGGKTIRSIIEKTGAQIDVESDGRVFISTSDSDGAKQALEMVEGLTREAKVGDVFLGKVVRIMPYGAFVNILPGKDGMVHISELAEGRVNTVEDVVNIDDEINVMVTDVEPVSGKISLSRRALLTGEAPGERQPSDNRGGGGNRNAARGNRGGGRGERDRPRPRRKEA
jgi:polyribonucleotide nucleotidyltransferase